METPWTARTMALLGPQALDTLANSRIVVLGLGGVGAAAAESLCRAGVGHILLCDADEISNSNRNRQLIATVDTVGQKKAEATQKRLFSINPEGDFTPICEFILPENLGVIFDWQPHCIIDAIDTVTTKLALATDCHNREIPLYMCMGTGGRLDPTQLRTGTIEDTAGCGCSLARVLRRELKRNGIFHLPVVYSLEPPSKTVVESEIAGRHPPSSTPFVPPAAGFALGSMAVRGILKI